MPVCVHVHFLLLQTSEGNNDEAVDEIDVSSTSSMSCGEKSDHDFFKVSMTMMSAS